MHDLEGLKLFGDNGEKIIPPARTDGVGHDSLDPVIKVIRLELAMREGNKVHGGKHGADG